MNKRIGLWLPFFAFFACAMALAQGDAQSKKTEALNTKPQAADAQKKNIDEYVELLRSNVRDEKAQIAGAVLQLNKEDAAKFWPIYSEYDDELAKLNKHKADNIQEFARGYSQMTDDRANEIAKVDLDNAKERVELLKKYYERVKESLGAMNAARFLQIENQLNSIIDLQIDSSLPTGQE